MRILVCVKQVPDTAEIKIDPVTNTLIRAGVPSIVNPFDAYALELAARIKDKEPGTKITFESLCSANTETVNWTFAGADIETAEGESVSVSYLLLGIYSV